MMEKQRERSDLRSGAERSACGGWSACEKSERLRGVMPRRMDGVWVFRLDVRRHREELSQNQIGMARLVEQATRVAVLVVSTEHRLHKVSTSGGR